MSNEKRPNVSIDLFLHCLKTVPDSMDETELYYYDNDQNEVYCIFGYIPQPDSERPFWVGYGCDTENGTDFATAAELVSAKVFCGKSLTERWNSVQVCNIGAISAESWFEYGPVKNKVIEKDGCWYLK